MALADLIFAILNVDCRGAWCASIEAFDVCYLKGGWRIAEGIRDLASTSCENVVDLDNVKLAGCVVELAQSHIIVFGVVSYVPAVIQVDRANAVVQIATLVDRIRGIEP